MARAKKIYVVIGGWDYEGFDDPVGVYSTKRLANKALKLCRKSYDHKDISEYTLDEMQKPPTS